jgi:hypothetical protein
MNRFSYFFGAAGVLLCSISSLAWAQAEMDKPPVVNPCLMVREEIVPLRVPSFDSAAIWKRTAGVKGPDIPRALLPVLDGGYIAIGYSMTHDDKTGFSAPVATMIRVNPLGKVLVEKNIDVKDMKSVIDGVLIKDRIVILTELSTESDSKIGLLFLNGAGEVKSNPDISLPAVNLIPRSIVSVAGGAQLLIAAEAISKRNENDRYTVLIWTDKDGKKIMQKEYLPGIKSRPEFVGRLPNGELVVTGRVATENNQMAAWVMRLSSRGDIIEQRPYPRGAESVARRAFALTGGDLIVVGDAMPAGQGAKAGWIMRLKADGEPMWQKYLTGGYAYSGIDAIQQDDGRITLLLAAKPSDKGGRHHARILTLSREGVIMEDSSFIEGSGAIPLRIAKQKDKRVVLGMAETGFSKETVTADVTTYIAYDTWLVGLAEPQPYQDNCSGSDLRSLDTLP